MLDYGAFDSFATVLEHADLQRLSKTTTNDRDRAESLDYIGWRNIYATRKTNNCYNVCV